MKNSSSTTSGTLYILATPIGHLDDISARAINTLKSVDVILAEDTRHSSQLLKALGIEKPLLSFHAHNEAEKCDNILGRLQQGESIALISDAGTPLISDPGFGLVRAARQLEINVVPIPGPSALITALCAAGIPCDSFLFTGFLPAKQQARLHQLATLKDSRHTVILYESTHRIVDCINDIMAVFGKDYEMVLAKELTKQFEQFMCSSTETILAWFEEDQRRIKGEFVLLLPPVPQISCQEDDQRLLSVLLSELPVKQAVKLAAQLSNSPKNDLYKLALTLK